MLLQEILNKEKNNLDIFRVIAAIMVIYGHSYALLPTPGPGDVLARLLGFDYSGSLAVKIFFFLSGLVVTNSLLTKRHLAGFLIARFFRIWPALAFTLLVSAFLLGPLLSEQSAAEYFSNKKVFAYFHKGLFMNIKYELPGVFEDNALRAINGSLWSIPHEVFAYLTLTAFFVLGLLKQRFRLLTIPIFILILIDPLLEKPIIFTWLPDNPEIRLLAPCFAFGTLLAIWKDKVDIDWVPCLAAWTAFFIFKQSCCNFYLFYLALFMLILQLSSRNLLIRLKPTADISYGIYLWGWPVQQILVLFFVEYGIRFNQVSAIFISVMMGLLSWYLIEKRSIAYGSHLARKIPSPWLGSSAAT